MATAKSKRKQPAETRARRAPRTESFANDSDAHTRSGDVNFMTSLARGLSVIRAFGEPGKTLTIAEVSAAVGIPRAAVRRCLYTLQQLGYASSDGTRFALLPKILSLGYAYLSSNPLSASAQPFLDRVSDAVHESCSLAILDEEHILYVARSTSSKRIMSVDISVGSRLPTYCTSMGRVLLAHLPDASLDAYVARVRLRAHTERTVTSREKLRQLLDTARRNDYAVVDQELEMGLRSIAVPVRNSAGKVVAAMNIGAQAARISIREMETTFLPHLRAAAGELAAALR